MKLSRHSVTAIAAAMALAATASPALARGGGGGGGGGTSGSPAPAPTNDTTLCPEFSVIGVWPTAPDGSTLFANEVGGIGCLIAKNSGGQLSIYEIRTGAGWVSEVKSSDRNKLDVQFTWPGDGTRHEITVQPGKTVIK